MISFAFLPFHFYENNASIMYKHTNFVTIVTDCEVRFLFFFFCEKELWNNIENDKKEILDLCDCNLVSTFCLENGLSKKIVWKIISGSLIILSYLGHSFSETHFVFFFNLF